MTMQLAQTYKIETSRLIIRCYQPADAAKLQTSINDSIEHLRPWIPWAQDEPQPVDWMAGFIRKFRGQFDLGQDAVYGIFDKQEKEIIGGTGLHNRVGEGAREIGYWINVKHINKGYASEAVCALTKVGFQIEGLERLEIHCSAENTRSNHIPEKLGYRQETINKHHLTDRHGKIHDEIIWTLNAKQYPATTIKAIKIRAYDFLDRMIPIS